MEKNNIQTFFLRNFYYCDHSYGLFDDYENNIQQLVRKYLGANTIVPLPKKFDLKHKNPVDYIPDMEYEDRSFPLDLLFKEQLERVFDADLSMVRIHTGEYSHELASKQGAKAVTMGNSIFFARGMYSPYTDDGLALLAHEVQHVVQYNDKDQSFLYDEDIILAEYMAESVEKQMKNMKLHNANSGVFNKDATVSRDNPENITNDTAPEIGIDKSLDDFSGENTEIRYEITTRDGSVYNISKEDRAKVIQMTTANVKDYIESELCALSDNERDKFLLKVLKYVSQ